MQKINKLRQTRTSFNIKKPKHYNKTNKKQAQRSMQYKWNQTTIYDSKIQPRQLIDRQSLLSLHINYFELPTTMLSVSHTQRISKLHFYIR